MREYDISFESLSVMTSSPDFKPSPKEVLAFVVEPSETDANTGFLLFSHGWDCNRFMDKPLMEFAADAFNVVCVSTEYRQSGYDFNPRTGKGFTAPYDLSFYQLLECAGALRHVLSVKKGLNRRRIFAYGLSQGGHLTLLLSIFAPNTFAFINVVSALTRPLATQQAWAGRDFSPDELSIRDAIEHADLIKCPVRLEHGTADKTLSHLEHAKVLEKRLKELGKPFEAVYHEGAGHVLDPEVSRLQAFKNAVGDKIMKEKLAGDDDFLRGSVVRIPCATKDLVVDWSKPQTDGELVRWEPKAVAKERS